MQNSVMNPQNIPLRFLTQDSIEYLNQLLKLDENRFYPQDWEIELAAPTRLEELLEAYENRMRNDDDRFSLMALIVCSFDDSMENGMDAAIWNRIRKHLLENFELHQYTIAYWYCVDTAEELLSEQAFKITPLIREIWRESMAEE